MHIEIKQPKKPQKKLNIELNKKFELIKVLLHCLYLADLCLLSFTDKNPKLIKKLKGSCNVMMKICLCPICLKMLSHASTCTSLNYSWEQFTYHQRQSQSSLLEHEHSKHINFMGPHSPF